MPASAPATLGRRTDASEDQAPPDLSSLGTTIVKTSWHMRIALEAMRANAGRRREFNDKTFTALWILKLQKRGIPMRGLTRLLRLSKERVDTAMEPLLEQKLVRAEEREEQLFVITPAGKRRVDEFLSTSAEQYRLMLLQLEYEDGELETLNSFADKVLRKTEEHIRTWVL